LEVTYPSSSKDTGTIQADSAIAISNFYYGQGITRMVSNSTNGTKTYTNYLITLEDGLIFRLASNLSIIDSFNLPSLITKAWGLTNDGTYLYISDSSDLIYVIDPNDNMKLVNTLNIVDSSGTAVKNINELEMVNSTYIYAN
jgi:glutamine cyclotransferase